MSKTPHLVEWKRPVPATLKSGAEMEGDLVYSSKCGRFQIRKRHMASGRNGYFCNVTYIMTDAVTGEKGMARDRLEDAKVDADWQIDPNFSPWA